MKQYKIVYEHGKYRVRRKVWFFFWVEIKENIEDYMLAPMFNTYMEASRYIQRWHWNKYNDTNYTVAR